MFQLFIVVNLITKVEQITRTAKTKLCSNHFLTYEGKIIEYFYKKKKYILQTKNNNHHYHYVKCKYMFFLKIWYPIYDQLIRANQSHRPLITTKSNANF